LVDTLGGLAGRRQDRRACARFETTTGALPGATTWDTAVAREDNLSKAQASVKWLRLLVILSVAVPLFIYLVFGAVGYVDAREEAELRVSRSLRVAHEHASKV